MALRARETDPLLRRSGEDQNDELNGEQDSGTRNNDDGQVDELEPADQPIGEGRSPEDGDGGEDDDEDAKPKLKTAALLQIVAVLAIGLFTSNLDSSFVTATHPRISSDFDALEDSSWILISFHLAGAATQTLYAGLSNIYGRKWLLIFCYALFAAGCATIGFAGSMWQVILGRAIQGSGGSGMASLTMILATDLVPLRRVATWFGYINVVATTGRSLGGPLGGWLTDLLGWRWSFLGQTPLFLAAIVLSVFVMPDTGGAGAGEATTGTVAAQQGQGQARRLRDMDFAGALLLGGSILTLMLPLELGGVKLPWAHPLIAGLFALAVGLMVVFVLVETRWTRYPIFPVGLLGDWEVIACYVVQMFQVAAQFGFFYFVPLYFQVTQRVSNTAAGIHMVPAIVGNALGGLVCGFLLRRMGSYKQVIILSILLGASSYVLCILRWRGDTNWWESMYIALGGLGGGILNNAIFVCINAVVGPADKAAAASGIFLAMPVGMVFGVAAGSAVMLQVMRGLLEQRLVGLGIGEALRREIIKKASENVDSLDELQDAVAKVVVSSYVDGLTWSYGVSLLMSAMALFFALTLSSRRID